MHLPAVASAAVDVSPPGTAAPPLAVEYADYPVRVGAQLVDLLLANLLGGCLASLPLGLAAALGARPVLDGHLVRDLALLCFLAYAATAEAVGGATLGKWLSGLRVRHEGLGPVGLRGALVRAATLPIEMFGPGFIAAGSMRWDARCRRHGDRLGRAVVVTARSLPPAARGGVARGVLAGLGAYVACATALVLLTALL